MTAIPKVQEITDTIIEVLTADNFFIDFEIENQEYTRKRFSEELTNKFLINGLDIDDEDPFTEDEYNQILSEIITENVLRNLQSKGYLESYEDETTEEVFFLTKTGKVHLNELRLEDNEDITS